MKRHILRVSWGNLGALPVVLALVTAAFMLGTLYADERSGSEKTERHNPPEITDLDDPGLTPEDVAQALVGPGVTIQNVTYTGAPAAAGIFSDGDPEILFTGGVILSSGRVVDIAGPNTSPSTSTDLGRPGDPDLTALSGFPTFDAAVLEFEFIPDLPKVSILYRFGSEEYNEWVFTEFNDVFAFFVNGENCATINGDPVSINTINHGFMANMVNAQNPDDFINNDPFDGGLDEALWDTEMDGFTQELTCETNVNPGVANTMKIAIADASDGIFDSWVVLEKASFTTDAPRLVREEAVRLAKETVGGSYTLGAKGWDYAEGRWLTAQEIKEDVQYTYYNYKIQGFDPNGVGLDCSGLIHWAYSKAEGAETFQGALEEMGAAVQCSPNASREVSEDELQPGDLVCFADRISPALPHVAMYIGEGEVVHADHPATGIVRESLQSILDRVDGFTGFRRLTVIDIDAKISPTPVNPHSPVQLVVTDPAGNTLTPDSIVETEREVFAGIPDAMYYATQDIDEAGLPIQDVIVPNLMDGQYIIHVLAKPGALPEDTFGIHVLAKGELLILADDVAISDIPPQGYGFTVTEGEVLLNSPPLADAGQNQLVECASHAGAVVNLDGTGSFDPDGDPLTFSWSAPGITFDNLTSPTPTATFPLGTTTVTLMVTDPGGLSDTDTVDITVQDTTPPTLGVTGSSAVLWPPDHQYLPIDLTVEVSDLCDPAPVVTAVAISSEPDNARGNGDGNTTGDIKVTTAAGEVLLSSNESPEVVFDPINDHLELRAERAGGGPGRVYTITTTATDASGNKAIQHLTVAVPHDQRE